MSFPRIISFPVWLDPHKLTIAPPLRQAAMGGLRAGDSFYLVAAYVGMDAPDLDIALWNTLGKPNV